MVPATGAADDVGSDGKRYRCSTIFAVLALASYFPKPSPLCHDPPVRDALMM
jgi:hypothetical protein